MLNVGLDVHWSSSSVCILDENGKMVKQFTRRGGWDKMLFDLANLQDRFRIVFEASCGYGTLYDRLRRLTPDVLVAHPGRLRGIFQSKRKNDRIDAQHLAKLLYLDEVPRVHVPRKQMRQWRQMIECRRRIIEKRTRTKNGIRSLLRGYGIRQPRGLWTNKGRQWLESVQLPGEWPQVQLTLLLEELEQFEDQANRITKQLDRIAARSPGVTLLRTIPGGGPRTAEAIVAYVDDPTRFSRVKQAGAYFGMVPCQDSSGPRERLGHITRQGPATARKYLVEATWQAVRRNRGLREYFERICGGKKERRKVALVATAHHLLRCMIAMLKSGEVWRSAA